MHQVHYEVYEKTSIPAKRQKRQLITPSCFKGHPRAARSIRGHCASSHLHFRICGQRGSGARQEHLWQTNRLLRRIAIGSCGVPLDQAGAAAE